MNFPDAIKSGFTRYIDFSGRSSRSEFWFWTLFVWVTNFILMKVDSLLLGADINYEYKIGHHILELIFGLSILVPNIAQSFRRLHDINKSAWFMLLVLIPIIGWLILLVWYCLKGTEGPNRFGPDPLNQ